jgi:Fe-S cluster assembly protein SufD
MMEHPRIVTSSKRGLAEKRDFNFSRDLVRDTGMSPDISQYRKRAWEAYLNFGIPTPDQEAWRRTDLRELNSNSFEFPKPGAHKTLPPVPQRYLEPLVDDARGGQIILLPGYSSIHLDAELVEKGVIFTDLITAEIKYPHLLEKILGKFVKPEDGKFAALAGAFSQNGIFLYIPKNTQIDQPLHSLIWGPGVGLAYISHVLVYVDEGASITYVHESASPTEEGGQTLHACNLEVYVGKAANLRFVELQSLGQNVWNFTHESVHVDQDANLDWIFGAVGSHLTKNFSDLVLSGPGSTGRMSGFYFSENVQHLDHDTQQYHLAPHTTSDLLFKGALTGMSHSVWQGMIYVAPGAFKTDGYQANRNLILSPHARADSIPGLEILADDVRCTHGATVGRIDEGEIFYLMSRGIPRMVAERIITEGFFDPIMQRIPFEGVRDRLFAEIHKKMGSDQ